MSVKTPAQSLTVDVNYTVLPHLCEFFSVPWEPQILSISLCTNEWPWSDAHTGRWLDISFDIFSAVSLHPLLTFLSEEGMGVFICIKGIDFLKVGAGTLTEQQTEGRINVPVQIGNRENACCI